jgi:hypothetical protein
VTLVDVQASKGIYANTTARKVCLCSVIYSRHLFIIFLILFSTFAFMAELFAAFV